MTAVHVATPVDAAEAARIIAAGFHQDPVMCWVFEGDDASRSHKLLEFFGFILAEAYLPLGATAMADGACGAWCPPPGYLAWPEDRGRRFGALLGTICTPGDIERLGILDAEFGAVHPQEPIWYLGLLATVPERQGRGLASALLAHTLALVDSHGAPAYLEASNPRHVGLYERHGFETRDEFHLGGTGPPVITMWRPPRRLVEDG